MQMPTYPVGTWPHHALLTIFQLKMDSFNINSLVYSYTHTHIHLILDCSSFDSNQNKIAYTAHTHRSFAL